MEEDRFEGLTPTRIARPPGWSSRFSVPRPRRTKCITLPDQNRARFPANSIPRWFFMPARSVRLTDWACHHILRPSPVLDYRNRRGWFRVICRNSQKGLHYETNIALHHVGAVGAGRHSPECARIQLDGRNEGRQAGL